MSRQANIARYLAATDEMEEQFGAGDQFQALVRERLEGTTRSDEVVAAIISAVYDEMMLDAEQDAAMEQWQDDIDSGWAAERAALSRAW